MRARKQLDISVYGLGSGSFSGDSVRVNLIRSLAVDLYDIDGMQPQEVVLVLRLLQDAIYAS